MSDLSNQEIQLALDEIKLAKDVSVNLMRDVPQEWLLQIKLAFDKAIQDIETTLAKEKDND
jgi:hypothetical protein